MKKPVIATLGSHSALDICRGAKARGFRTVVLCQRGREKTYRYFKTSRAFGSENGCIDELVVLEKFSHMVEERVQKMLERMGAIFIPHRSFVVYVGLDAIEKKFRIPLFGNRWLLRAEERNEERNQYYLMKKAGIRMPKIYKPEEIDAPVIVKVGEAERRYERAFFVVSSYEEYLKKAEELVKRGKIRREDLENAVIEEFIVGAHFNFNFFYSPLLKRIELLGIDTRRQTNLEGILRLPSDIQKKAIEEYGISYIEVGHIACTLRESLLQRGFEAAEKLVRVCRREYPPGIIGPFALQGAMVPRKGREEFVVFDVSFRMPGSPGTKYTPYSYYLWGREISFGERIAMEIEEAVKREEVEEVIT